VISDIRWSSHPFLPIRLVPNIAYALKTCSQADLTSVRVITVHAALAKILALQGEPNNKLGWGNEVQVIV
jgi:hypothetical protein